ncbi:MAG: peptidoglycan-binding protein [Thermodesulfovibrionia bacterium]|nr:peptidoglycan-binding protein [Thermodesulfovibrionia bacterium]
MSKKMFLKIWAGVLSSLSLSATESVADLQIYQREPANDKFEIIMESSKPDIFLKHAKETYSDSMLFAGHRSHRSHQSHYSSYSNPDKTTNTSTKSTEKTIYTPSTNPDTTTSPENSIYTPSTNQNTNTSKKLKELNSTDIKMIQFSLNLLGFSANKVDGIMSSGTKSAIEKFQTSENLTVSGKMDGQTCLFLARKLKENFPDNADAKAVHTHLMSLYMKLESSTLEITN